MWLGCRSFDRPPPHFSTAIHIILDELLAEIDKDNPYGGFMGGYVLPVGDFHIAVGPLLPITDGAARKVEAWGRRNRSRLKSSTGKQELARLVTRTALLDVVNSIRSGENVDEA